MGVTRVGLKPIYRVACLPASATWGSVRAQQWRRPGHLLPGCGWLRPINAYQYTNTDSDGDENTEFYTNQDADSQCDCDAHTVGDPVGFVNAVTDGYLDAIGDAQSIADGILDVFGDAQPAPQPFADSDVDTIAEQYTDGNDSVANQYTDGERNSFADGDQYKDTN